MKRESSQVEPDGIAGLDLTMHTVSNLATVFKNRNQREGQSELVPSF